MKERQIKNVKHVCFLSSKHIWLIMDDQLKKRRSDYLQWWKLSDYETFKLSQNKSTLTLAILYPRAVDT